MLIVALVLAVVSLAALVTAVVTSNEAIAWVCIGFSALGVLLLIVDAIRDRHRRPVAQAEPAPDLTEVAAAGVGATEVIAPVEGDADYAEDHVPEDQVPDEEYPDEQDFVAELEDHPEETVHDEPDYDLPSDDEPSYPVPAEEAAVHIVGETDILADSESDIGSDAVSATPVSYESSPDTDHSITVIYSGEPYTGESSTLTESYVVITDEPDTAAGADEPVTVIYADETGVADAAADEIEDSGERGSESAR